MMKTLFKHWLQRTSASFPTSIAAGSEPAASHQEKRTPVLPYVDYWTEQQVDTQQLLGLFRQAFIPVESGPNDRLYVDPDGGAAMMVTVDQDRKSIEFRTCFPFPVKKTRLDRLELVNKLNDTVTMVRFSVHEESTLLADYLLPFDGGITPAVIIATLRRTSRISLMAIARLDGETNVAPYGDQKS